ncbi:hypothetical protein A6M21_05245 [Desulfotomaculum copahuensis]|uniref:Major facilitator superfamily (MFS) profile domain-containing protein n=2 Tax=Desulfotomaculum copahuensis TaxID=1838280 RepID=A0A1B7LHW8_9FIRM|nr:hypothetical protein A6M21_05245 [Desulfotomaculum copahuensis]
MLTSLIRVWGGGVSDKIGGARTGVLALTVMLIGALVMTFSHAYLLSLIGEIVMAFGMGVANAAVFKLVPQAVPEAVGGATGWVGGLGAFGGFVIPPLLGLFVQHYGGSGYALGFLIFIILSVAALTILRSFGKTACTAGT